MNVTLSVSNKLDLGVFLHGRFALVFMIYALLLGLWGLVLFVLNRNPSGGYLGALILAEAVAVLTVILGAILFVTGHRPHLGLHYLYGAVALLTLPAAYTYSARGTERRDSLIFGIACLFLFVIAIRATGTAS